MDSESPAGRGGPAARFGSLLLGDPVGPGIVGEVWHARDAAGGARKALEVLPAGASEVAVRALVDQHHALRVPGVVPAVGFQVSGGRVGVLWEWVDGPTLADVLDASSAMGLDEALELYAEMLEVIRAVHHRGLTHLALSPRAFVLVVRGDGVRPHLVGLGMVAALGRLGLAAVDERYRAPEQLAGAPGDARSDVYAMAAILYEMLTGTPAFPGGRGAASSRPKPLYLAAPQCPREISEVVRQALSADPAQRPATMDAFIDALLGPSTAERPVEAPIRPTPAPSRPAARAQARPRPQAAPSALSRLAVAAGWVGWALSRLLTFLVLPALVMALAGFTVALFAGRQTWTAAEAVSLADARAASDAEVARWAAAEVVAMGGNAERVNAAVAELDRADTLRRRGAALLALRSTLELELHGLSTSGNPPEEARRRRVANRLDDVAVEADGWEQAVIRLDQARALPLARLGAAWGLAEEDWVAGLAAAWARYEATGRPEP